jgi:pimeloyl-ACP methyl ester carboxylesterase
VGTPPVSLGEMALAAFFSSEDMDLAGKAEFSEADALNYGTAMLGGREFLIPELLRAIRRTDGNARKFMYANALKGVGSDERRTVARSPKAVCVVHGEREPFVRLDYLASLTYRALWRKRIFVIPGAGHAPHWQQPERFNEILLDFLGLTPSENC